MKIKALCIVVFCLMCCTAHAETVTWVTDGDTVVLDNVTKVRLIGIDTPEYHKSQKMYRDSKKTACTITEIHDIGEKAYDFTNRLLYGQKVEIKYDKTMKDRYGRTLGYLYLKDGTFFNLEVVKQGFSKAYTRFPFKYKEKFVKAEAEAKAAKRGFWAEPKCL